jgi:hypothetical protein
LNGIDELAVHSPGKDALCVMFTGHGRSTSAAELYYLSAVALRWPSGWHGVKLHGSFALGCGFQSRFFAFFGFAVKRLRHRRWPAYFAEQQNVYLKVAAIVSDLQLVAHMDLARRLGGLPIRLNPAQITCSRRQSASLEKPGRPKPFIDAYRRHEGIVL